VNFTSAEDFVSPMRFTNVVVLVSTTLKASKVEGFSPNSGYLASLSGNYDAATLDVTTTSTSTVVESTIPSEDEVGILNLQTTSKIAVDEFPNAKDILFDRNDAVRRGIEFTRNRFGFRNDGKFWFMKTAMGGYQPQSGSVKRVVYGVPVDVNENDVATVTPERAKELRRIAAESLTNIDNAERERRLEAGNTILLVTALYATVLSLVWLQNDDLLSHVIRFATVLPLYSTGYGIRQSGKAGL